MRTSGVRILCFGDSLTWGYVPAGSGRRYPEEVRWTSLLAKELGATVIEEGLNGRTSSFPDPLAPFACGADTIEACVMSQMPLDLIVIMLGTNDMKTYLAHQAGPSARGIVNVASLAKGVAPDSGVLVVCPPPMGRHIVSLDSSLGMMEQLDEKSVEESWGLAKWLGPMCASLGLSFMDAGEYVSASASDAIHLDEEGHRLFAQALAEKIRALS